jgi:hypothetical protein
MNIFTDEYRKVVKNDIAEFFFQKYKNKKIESNNKYSSELILFNMKSWHMHCPVYIMIAISILPFPFAIACYIALLMVFILFIYLKGCFLSLTEMKINKENWVEQDSLPLEINIIDPLIMYCNAEINKTNRNKYSIYLVLPYIIVATLIMKYRFF